VFLSGLDVSVVFFFTLIQFLFALSIGAPSTDCSSSCLSLPSHPKRTCFLLCSDLITCMSFKFFIELVEGYPVPFALNYSLGNTLSLLSMTFLCGPKRQFENMFDEKRKFTSITYLSCLVATVGCIFLPLPGFAKLLLLVCLLLTQFCASMWYSLSYIPFGRRWALRCIKRQLGLTETAEYS